MTILWALWVHRIFQIYYAILILHVVGSWFPPSTPYTPWAKILGLAHALTEPLLGPIRRALHPYQRQIPVDFSPLILIVLLSVVERVLLGLVMGR